MVKVVNRWVLEIPGHTHRLNQLIGVHWGTKHRRRQKDDRLIATACRVYRVTPATRKRKVALTVILGPRQRGADPDAFWKSLLDALKNCGALKDDSPKWLDLGGVTYERGAAKGMRITIEDVL